MFSRAVRLDDLDFRILRELLVGEAPYLQGRRERVRAISHRVGAHANTVVRRLLGLRLKRFILPPTMMVDMERLGWHAGRALLNVPVHHRTHELHETLMRLDGVFAIFYYDEGWEIAVLASSATAVREQMERARNFSGASSIEWLVETAIDWPHREPVELDDIDRRLILALAPDARQSFSRLAREIGIEKRTLERRFRRLAETRAVRMFPSGGSRVANMAVANVNLTLSPTADRNQVLQEVLSILPNHFARDQDSRRPWLWVYAPNVESIGEAASKVLQVQGIERVRVLRSQGMRLSPHYTTWLARALSAQPSWAANPSR